MSNISSSKITIIIVTWNSMNFIYDCLRSLDDQTWKDFSVLVIDNGSSDGGVQYIRESHPNVSLLENFKNTGFAYANNQGIKISKSEYVLLLNADVILEKDFLKYIIECARRHPASGSVSGKVMKAKFENIDTEVTGKGLRTPVRLDILDTTGLQIYKNRSVVNRGEGESAHNRYEKEEQIFGVSACAALYRKEALEDAKIYNEYFDENFFSYKEDVDLAWRLRLLGWEAWYTPEARAYHHRGFSSYLQKTPKKIIESRKKVSTMIRTLSFRNHFLTLAKNDTSKNVLAHIFSILWRHTQMILYALLIERFLFKNMKSFFAYLPSTLKKRKAIMMKKKVTNREIRAWFR